MNPAGRRCWCRSSGRCRSPARGRSADPGGRGRRQPARRLAAPRTLPPPPGASDIPGLEVAGVDRRRSGPACTDWRVGDAVCALVTGGGYAEYCVAPAPQCLPVPRGHGHRRRPRRFPRRSSPSGPTCSSAGACSRASRFWSTAARAASARRRFSWRRRAARACSRPPGRRRSARACERLGAERCINYRDDDFVAAVRDADRRPRRRRHPRHGRRRLLRAQHRRAGGGRAAGARSRRCTASRPS